MRRVVLAGLTLVLCTPFALAQADQEDDWVTLQGVLLFGDDPVPGGTVGVRQEYLCDGTTCTRVERGAWSNYTETDEAGRWMLRAPPGGLHLWADEPDPFVDAGQPQVELTTRAGETHMVDLVFPGTLKDLVKLEGRVVDRVDREPLANVDVRVHVPGVPYFGRGGTTDEAGRFQLEVPRGRVVFEIEVESVTEETCPDATPEHEPGGPSSIRVCPVRQHAHDYHSYHGTMRLEKNQTEVTVEMARLAPKGDVQGTRGEILGWVIDEGTGIGLEGVLLSVYNEVTFEWGEAWTDEHGGYRLAGTTGHLHIDVMTNRHEWMWHSFDLRDGGVAHVDFVLTPGLPWQCCYGFNDTYEIPETGPAPPPPPRPISSSEAQVRGLREPHDVIDEEYGLARWVNTYDAPPAQLGPYDADADFTFVPDAPVAEAGTGGALGVFAALAALAVVATKRRRV